MIGAVSQAAPAAAATTTIDCDTAAQPSASWTTCQKLVGTAKCVWNNKDNTYTLAVGYRNPTGDTLLGSIPEAGAGGGANNAFTATGGFAANPGHADSFNPGTYTTAWTVTWTPSSKTDDVSWLLMGKTYTWARTYTACPSKPVPVIGNGIAGSLGLVAVMGLSLVHRRRFADLIRTTRLVGAAAR